MAAALRTRILPETDKHLGAFELVEQKPAVLCGGLNFQQMIKEGKQQ